MIGYAVSSCEIYAKLKSKIEDLGFKFINSYTDENLPKNLKNHIDLTLIQIDNMAISAPNAYDYYTENLLGIKIEKGIAYNEKLYPKDTIYNAVYFNNYIIHNERATDLAIKALDKEFINVKQAYTKCNILKTDRFLITGDCGIYKSLSDKNLPVKLIDDRNVLLKGYSKGFIGGACGNNGSRVFINGDINYLPDLKEFLLSNNYEIIDVPNESIRDIGSILFFEI